VLELGCSSARVVSGLPAEAQLFNYHNDSWSNKHRISGGADVCPAMCPNFNYLTHLMDINKVDNGRSTFKQLLTKHKAGSYCMCNINTYEELYII